jgi:uncharacterized Tic20 family protein
MSDPIPATTPSPQHSSTPAASPPVDDASEVTTLAGVVHLLYFAQSLGIIVAGILWAVRGKRSPYLAFQCAQAIIVQGGLFLLTTVLMVVMFAGMFIAMAIGTVASTTSGDAAFLPFVFGIPLFFAWMGVFFLLWVAGAAISLWAAVRCFQKEDPWVPGIGGLAARMTGHRRGSMASA